MQYWDFDLEIDPGTPGTEQEYLVSARTSREGEAHATMHFPFDKLQLDDYLSKLQQALNSGAPHRRIPAVREQPVLEFGQTLFESLFAGEVGEPITTDDFVYWLDVLRDLNGGLPAGYDQIVSYTARDAYTMVLKYK